MTAKQPATAYAVAGLSCPDGVSPDPVGTDEIRAPHKSILR